MSEERTVAFRFKLYQDPNVRSLLSAMLSGEIPIIRPSPDVVYKSRYPSLEKKLNLIPEEVEALLGKLTDAGLLACRLATNILTCPACKSFRLILYPLCPECKMRGLTRSTVYEHIPCGQIGLEQLFMVGDKLSCRRCGKDFKKIGVDYTVAGVLYQYRECRRSFDIPTFECGCQERGNLFLLMDASLLPLFEYRFNESYKDEVLGHILSLEPIRNVLAKMGFEVTIPGFLVGSSGVRQRFDIVGRYPGPTAEYIVVDVASGTEIPAENLLSLFAKSADVKPRKSVLVAIPKLKEDARPLLSVYKIECIESGSVKEAAERLEQIIKV